MTTPIQNSASLIAALNAANSSLGKTSSTSTNGAISSQSQFLTMLTAQLQNQDPINPMDNAQITSQMAQLSTVTGVNQLNSTLTALSNSMALGQSVSATSMIGQGVLVAGSSLNLSGGQAIGGVDLTQPADSLSVTIKNSSGAVVQTLQLGAQSAAGVVPFSWNGLTSTGATAPDGAYTFATQATLSGATSKPTSLAYGTVNAITPGTTGATVTVGTLGGFALSAIKQVL